MYTLHVGHILHVRTNILHYFLPSEFLVIVLHPRLGIYSSQGMLYGFSSEHCYFAPEQSGSSLLCSPLPLLDLTVLKLPEDRGKATLVLLKSFLPSHLLNELDMCTLSLYFFFIHLFVLGPHTLTVQDGYLSLPCPGISSSLPL